MSLRTYACIMAAAFVGGVNALVWDGIGPGEPWRVLLPISLPLMVLPFAIAVRK